MCRELVVADAELAQHFGRCAGPVHDGPVAQVADVLDADLARPEAGCDQVAHRRKKTSAVAHVRPRAARKRDVVEDGASLLVRALEERLVEPLPAFRVQPREAAPYGRLPIDLLGDDVVDELGGARVRGAAGPIVLWKNDVREGDDSRILVRREEPWLIGLALVD